MASSDLQERSLAVEEHVPTEEMPELPSGGPHKLILGMDPDWGEGTDVNAPHIRLECWRTKDRFPDVCAGLEWLWEMMSRVDQGIPPVGEVEFAGLAAWFGANDSRLHQLSLPSELLDVKVTLAGNEQFESWRERDHDDLVLAVALALYEGSRPGGYAVVVELPSVRRPRPWL